MKLKAIFSAVLAAAVMTTSTVMTASALEVTADKVNETAWGTTYNWENINFLEQPDGTLMVSGVTLSEEATELIIPDTVNGKMVTWIDWIYVYAPNLVNVVILETAVIINEQFAGTQWLENRRAENPLVVVNNNLIDGNAFTGDDIVIPSGVTRIGDDAFHSYNSETNSFPGFKSLTIPKSLTFFAMNNSFTVDDIYYEGSEEEFRAIDCYALKGGIAGEFTFGSMLDMINGKIAYDYGEIPASDVFGILNGATIHYNYTGYGNSDKPDDSTPADKTVEYASNNVTATADAGVIPDGAEFSAAVTKNDNGGYDYDLKFVKDGAKVQPNGKVTIKLSLPEEFTGKTVYVFRKENDRYINMNAKVDGGYIVFETDHFSEYVLTTQDLNASTNGDTSTSEPDKSNSSNNSSNNSSSNSSDSSTSDKENSENKNPPTGAAGIALAFGAIAAAGTTVVVSRKRR